jgi:hypothetical protein
VAAARAERATVILICCRGRSLWKAVRGSKMRERWKDVEEGKREQGEGEGE